MRLENVFGLGFISGLRSMMALAVISDRYVRGELKNDLESPFALIQEEQVSHLLKLAALGEMVGDKLPFVPARTSFFPLVGRIGTGIAVGVVLAPQREARVLYGFVGGLGAVAGAYAGYWWRTLAHYLTPLPNHVSAAAEDAAALLGARYFTSAEANRVDALPAKRKRT